MTKQTKLTNNLKKNVESDVPIHLKFSTRDIGIIYVMKTYGLNRVYRYDFVSYVFLFELCEKCIWKGIICRITMILVQYQYDPDL